MYYMYFMYYSWCLFKHRRRNSFNQGQPHILLQQKRLHNSEDTNPCFEKLKTKSLLAASLCLNPSIFLSQANDVSRQIVPLCCVSIINERAQQHRYYRAKNKRQQINTKVFRFFLLLFFNRLKYLGPMSIMNTA